MIDIEWPVPGSLVLYDHCSLSHLLYRFLSRQVLFTLTTCYSARDLVFLYSLEAMTTLLQLLFTSSRIVFRHCILD